MSGCSGLANTPRNRRKANWKRFCASFGGRSGTGGCFPMMNSTSGMRLDDQLAVRPHRLLNGACRQPLYLRFALDQDLTDQSLESLCQGRVRDVALVLVELAGREEAARRNKHLVQLIHYGGFADTRNNRRRAQVPACLGSRPGRRPRVARRSRPPARTVSPGSAIGPTTSCAPNGNGSMRPCDCHSARHCRRSASRPTAVW